MMSVIGAANLSFKCCRFLHQMIAHIRVIDAPLLTSITGNSSRRYLSMR